MRGVSKIGQLLLQRYAAQLRHHTLLILCDNQGTVSNFNKMGAGSLAAFQLVRDLYEAAMAADVQLQFQWRPREDPAIAAADALPQHHLAQPQQLLTPLGGQNAPPSTPRQHIRQTRLGLQAAAPEANWAKG